MIMSNIPVAKLIYYTVAVAFHLVLLFTNVGNYFHGGNVFELVAMQATAVLIVVAAFKLLQRVGLMEKVLIGLCAFVPTVSIIWSLISAVAK
jgi:hypothetical protein